MRSQFLKFPIILLLLFIGISAFPQEAQPDVGVAIDNETNKEEAFRQKIELEASQIATDARKAFERDEYAKAITDYLAAIDKMKQCGASSTYIQNKVKHIQQNMAVVYLYWGRETAVEAEKLAKAGQFDKAIELCVKAMKLDPSLVSKMNNLITRYQNKQKTAKYQNLTDEETVDPKKESRLYEIDVLMLQGNKLYREAQWHRAREKYEDILLIDPYHLNAMEKVKKLTKKIYQAGKNRYEATQEERNAEVEWNYVSPLIARSLAPSEEAPEPIEREQQGSKIKEKLENITIDHMEFEDASISAVVNLLRVRAKDLDPQKEGINIFLRLGGTAAPAAEGPEDDPEEDAGDDDDFLAEDDDEGGDEELVDDAAGEGGDASDKTITIMFDDLSLGEAIRNICIAADMNYRVEEYAVVIAAKSVALDNLETRIYPVEQDAFQEMGAGDAEDGSTTSVKGYFERRGINFPEAGRIVYDNSISRLIATNTHENLRKIEQIIDELNVIDPQVLIEAKFVEIQENKTDELGFGWTIAKPAADPRNRNQTFDANDQLLRFLNNPGDPGLGGQDVALDVTKNFHGTSVALQIHAMNLSDRTDLLATPRITTQNGEEATIRMVTEQYFPESWGETTIITDATGTGFNAGMPEFGEPTEIGVRMTVTPTVDPDKYTISLDMIPVVQSHVGWVDYSYQVSDGAGGQITNTLIMPIIEARTIQTQITIYDGETVVMGGIMRDITATVDDRIPILGDLPLVGRMFRSKYVDKSKANLLIFTTVRLVNPDGSPLREREVRGKPPFRM